MFDENRCIKCSGKDYTWIINIYLKWMLFPWLGYGSMDLIMYVYVRMYFSMCVYTCMY